MFRLSGVNSINSTFLSGQGTIFKGVCLNKKQDQEILRCSSGKTGHLQVVSLCSGLQQTCKANKSNKVNKNGNKVVDLQMWVLCKAAKSLFAGKRFGCSLILNVIGPQSCLHC